MKKMIDLTYVEKGVSYKGSIVRESFLNYMQHLVSWYPDRNANATKLCELIPEMESIKINQDILDTQDVPFIEYKCPEDSRTKMLRLSRPCRIIWSILEDYCDQAKNNH